jgi:hypothetical protein
MDPLGQFSRFEQLRRDQSTRDQDVCPGDRVLETEHIQEGDLDDPLDRRDRVQAGEVVGSRNRLLAPASKTAQAASFVASSPLSTAPQRFWSLDDPLWKWAAGAASHQTLSFSQKAIEK